MTTSRPRSTCGRFSDAQRGRERSCPSSANMRQFRRGRGLGSLRERDHRCRPGIREPSAFWFLLRVTPRRPSKQRPRLLKANALPLRAPEPPAVDEPVDRDRKSVVSGKSVSVRVELGGRRIIKKKKNERENKHSE